MTLLTGILIGLCQDFIGYATSCGNQKGSRCKTPLLSMKGLLPQQEFIQVIMFSFNIERSVTHK